MKKIVPILTVVVVAAALWFAVSARVKNDQSSPASDSGSAVSASSVQAAKLNANTGGDTAVTGDLAGDTADGDTEVDLSAASEKSAVELYKSADDAMKAIKDAAADYDDLVLDQFTELPANCSWCPQFYAQLKDMIASAETSRDQKSYFAEVLAISGRVENIKALAEGVLNAKTEEDGDMYAEALELTVGKDDVVKYLGEQLGQSNEKLREASVAAITNQGSRQSVELLYAHTAERGDPDGYYSMGIGLGEVVPEESALPYLQDLVKKRDQYSHLAFKGLLNSGVDGLKITFDMLSNSPNPEFDRELVKGAIDHVSFDDESLAAAKQVIEQNKGGVAQQFAQDIVSSSEQTAQEDAAADEEAPEEAAPFTPLRPGE